jgi:hypothetical protein
VFLDNLYVTLNLVVLLSGAFLLSFGTEPCNLSGFIYKMGPRLPPGGPLVLKKNIVASIDKSYLKTKEDELLVFFANHGTFID